MMDYGLAIIRSSVKRKRESSYDRTGGNCDHLRLHPGEETVLLDVKGSGCIRHIWFTIGSRDPLHLKNMILRAYWDGEKNPSILCPIGDFFGLGHGVYTPFETDWISASAKNGRALNCFFPMPFSTRARITVEHRADGSAPTSYFYYYIDYEETSIPKDAGRFHASFRRESLTRPDSDLCNVTGKGNYEILNTDGCGQFVGTIINVDSPSPVWNGEGDDMFFIDGTKWPPDLHGTGTEDYFNTAWCPGEKIAAPNHGLILAAHPEHSRFLGKATYYRFHVKDPVMFKKSLRCSIEHGTGNEFVGDWSSTAFWYANRRKQPLPPLPEIAELKPLPALKKEVGKLIEQPHKSLSYFYQTGHTDTGEKLIDELEVAWKNGAFDLKRAGTWSRRVWQALRDARASYLAKEDRVISIPRSPAKGRELSIDRIHGSHRVAPRAARIFLSYTPQCLLLEGSMEIEKRKDPGYEYDSIEVFASPSALKERFVKLTISPGRRDVEVAYHEPNGWHPWDEMTPSSKHQVNAEISVDQKSWTFRCAVPWKILGLKPVVGTEINFNVERWNMQGNTWWASWAITPHHFYPPQVGGVVRLA